MNAESLTAAHHDPKAANVIYHDWEADTYDDKWSISYDERCITYARDLFDETVGTGNHPTYETALEVGGGSGFFLLNLMQSGIASTGCTTDISSKMVRRSVATAATLGLTVRGAVADVECLPFADQTFDLVIGHAFLHHIPDVDAALAEILRVLTPGGRFVICGEPTTRGDVIARHLSRATWWAATTITRHPWLLTRWGRSTEELRASSEEAALEAVVDLHTFDPGTLADDCRRAGAVNVRATTQELTAAWFGWPVRTFEAAVQPSALGWRWATFAYRTWQTLNTIDRSLFRAIIPPAWFYNVCVTGERP